MLSYWLSQTLPMMEVTLVLAFVAFAAFLAWLSFASPLAPVLQGARGVVPPFVNIAGTLFALMVTFLSQDIWESNRQARRAINKEHEYLLTLRALSEVNGSVDETLRAAIREYVEAVVGLEWKTMEDGEGAPEAQAALDHLTRVVARTSTDRRFERALTETALGLNSAREQRLSIANAFPDDRKWAAVFLLAFLTQISLAATHLERPRPQLMAQAIFAGAAVISLSLVASVEKPFEPPDATSAQPLAEILNLIPEK
ncbi:DUF4239 domain-containing protein [Methylocystis sp. ATCC 49242]|uniref:bestrophin-like domain n=1 Tax=Methylocystis sp. ATCC 49242 TaxID=622637 RepID=UPI0001F8840E|nr:DUF4239 domain-containing protein [Methylocystis sp. ATCC 49242]